MRSRLHRGFERLLEAIVAALMTLLALVVVAGVAWRTAGAPLVWYDEVASILLAWVTYYGAALAGLKRAHIGFPGFVAALPRRGRLATLVLSELVVLLFLVLLAWSGLTVLEAIGGDTLISLPWIPLRLAQSVIPAGAAFFLAAELLSLRDAWAAARDPEPAHPGAPA